MALSNTQRQVGSYWSGREHKANPVRHFWTSPTIVRHINRRVCGVPVNGMSQGLTERLKQHFPNKRFKRGISVGCGEGIKEAKLIKQGIVETFDLFELSTDRISKGKRNAEKLEIADRMNFVHDDAFSKDDIESYDFVNWTASLHHMFNVKQAVEWSFDILKKGGIFYMDEYVGPNHLQFTDEMLELASDIRQNLPSQYLCDPKKPDQFVPIQCKRRNLEKLLLRDPSEAADSSKIIESVQEYFPDAEIIFTGGIVYFIALDGIMGNFNEKQEDDVKFLNLLLKIDDLLSDAGHNIRASALAVKD